MSDKKMTGYVKSENVIWFVVASLLIGFIGGVAFGIYKSGRIPDPHQSGTPAGMDAERQQAMEAARQAERMQAISSLKERTRQNPGDIDAWVQLGHQYFDANQVEEAINAYETALAIKPEDANVWTDLGVMYRRNGQPQKAIEAFDRAMTIDASHEISRFNKGIVLFHDLKDETGALAAWESLLAINPNATSPSGQTVKQLVDHIKSTHQEDK
jgi:cytochrome c-type biogenesis protein CcmH/NrfG